MRVLNHIGVSGGKDSTALLLWARYESGYDPKTITASFCDTGNEAAETYAYVQMLSEKVLPITTIKPERDFWELARHKKRFPSARARFCTQELKMKPTRDFVNALRLLGAEPLMHAGVRAAESADRAKLAERELHTYFGCEVYRPLLSWTIDDVWAIHKRYGIEPNPLYSMGCKRVGCLPCIMSRKAEIGNISRRWPERIDFIRTQERTLRDDGTFSGMFHRDTVPRRWLTCKITTKTGEAMQVATIDDVVRWAQDDPNFQMEEFDFFDDAPGCDSRYGACE